LGPFPCCEFYIFMAVPKIPEISNVKNQGLTPTDPLDMIPTSG